MNEIETVQVIPSFRKDTEYFCDQCGKSFVRNPLQVKGKNRFCSLFCHNIFMKGRFRKEFQKRSRASRNRYIAIVEKVLGKNLPSIAVVHHVNLNKKDNKNSNLVICQNSAYHNLIHKRARIVMAGGHPSIHRICSRCNTLKQTSDFDPIDARKSGYCIPCKRQDTNHRRRLKNGINIC